MTVCRTGRTLAILAFAVVALASCTQSQSNKFVAAGYAGQAKSVAVASSMSAERIAANPAEFRAALEKQLAACGVQASFAGRTASYRSSSPNRPDSYMPQDAIADVGSAPAEAILIVGETARHTMTQNFQTQEIGREYRLQYYDVPSKAVVWSTDVYMAGGTTFQLYKPDEKSQRLASLIVTGLAADGILRNCPPGPGK